MEKIKFSDKKYYLFKLFGPIAAIALVIVLLFGPFFLDKKIVNASETEEEKYIFNDIYYNLSNNVFGFMSAYNNKYIDIEGGLKCKKETPIIAYDKNYNSNQRFILNAIETTPASYVYTISTVYLGEWVLDISGASSNENVKLQLYSKNDTSAQKFIIKEVYEKIDGENKFVGYVIFTGASNYKKVLSINESNYIVQTSVNTKQIDKKQIWYLDKGFTGYAYSSENPGYYDKDKQPGYYNQINYGTKNDKDGFYSDVNFWAKFEDFLSILPNEVLNPQKARITDYGYTYFGDFSEENKATLNIRINSKLNKKNTKIASDKSCFVNDKYVNGTVNYGCVEVEHIDDNNVSFSTFTNDALKNINALYDKDGNFISGTLNFKNKNNNQSFGVGRYVIRVYYKVGSSNKYTYVMKEYSFAIGSTSTECFAIKSTEKVEGAGEIEDNENKTLASYKFTVNDDNIVVTYDGDEKFRAKDDEIIDYVAGFYNLTEDEIKSKTETEINEMRRQKMISDIKTYNEYKIYFTNTAFMMHSGGNHFVNISSTEYSKDNSLTTYSVSRSKTFIEDGIYDFISINMCVFGEKNFYRVLLQSEPNKQVFRNVTYCYLDENSRVVNYAIDYAFLEDVKIFPYTMTQSITYQNITNGEGCEINYNSCSIIYNTTKDVLKLKFVIRDISGNEQILYLDIFPSSVPTLNKENLEKSSYEFNYISNGYSIKLFDKTSKTFENYLFSSKEVALENFISNIFENEEVCKEIDGKYELTYNPDGTDDKLYFDDNESLVDYLYDLFSENIKQTIINPNEKANYKITEKAMHYDTLFLDKNFYFTSNESFPLFESYKIYFFYYGENSELIKEGIITYNGEYRYGQTMFKILADEKEENWKSGYVKFVEYNISANKGSEYIAHIVNSNSNISLKLQQGTKYEKKTFSESISLTCEEFEISQEPSENTTYVITYKGEDTILNYYNFKTKRFKESGEYKITIINTHGFSYEIFINVYGLSEFIEGVDNYKTTEQDVTFISDDFNFQCYINGKLQDNANYDAMIDNHYVYKFTKSSVDKNVVIYKNHMQFAFIIKGESRFDVSPYYSSESTYISPSMVKEYRLSIEKEINNINYHLNSVQNLLQNFENVSTFKIEDIDNKKYDYYSTLFNEYKSKLEEENLFLEKIINSDNILLKQNDNFDKIYDLKYLLDNFEEKFDEFNKNFGIYATDYFKAKGIILPQNKIEDLAEKNEEEIINLYNESISLISLYENRELEIIEIYKKINKIMNYENEILSEINFIETNYKKIEKLSKYNELMENIDSFKKSYNKNLIDLRTNLMRIECNDTNNPFLEEYLVKLMKNKSELLSFIENRPIYDFSQRYSQIKQNIFQNASTISEDYSNYINNIKNQYDENIEIINKNEEDKSWWKIFSNIERNKQIKKAKENIKNLYDNNRKEIQQKEKELTQISTYLKNIDSLNDDIISDDLIEKYDKLSTQLSNLYKNIIKEI